MSGVIVEDKTITLKLAQIISKDLLIINQIILYDLFSLHYKNQNILIIGEDGENVTQSGFLVILYDLQRAFSIPDSKIVFMTVIPPPTQYEHIPVEPKFFNLAGDYANTETTIDLTQAKFVGVLAASRFSFIRMRSLYEVDQAFAGDTYLTFKNTEDDVRNRLGLYSNNYHKELDWLRTKQFDNPQMEVEHPQYAYNGLDATAQYTKIWNKFAIEVILETDEFANNWFTEKTGKCLATGKPFVLMAGQHSLHNLREMGFQTFSTAMGETYDKCTTPTLRLKKIIKSLKGVYNAPNRLELIQKMYKIAEENKIIYKELTKNVQSEI